MSLRPPASLFYHVYIVKSLKLNQRRILQVTGLWLRSSKRKGRVETRESKRRYATMYACMTPVGFGTCDKFEKHCSNEFI